MKGLGNVTIRISFSAKWNSSDPTLSKEPSVITSIAYVQASTPNVFLPIDKDVNERISRNAIGHYLMLIFSPCSVVCCSGTHDICLLDNPYDAGRVIYNNGLPHAEVAAY